MSSALRELITEPPPPKEKIEAFLEGKTFPIVEGKGVTFVFHGRADEVFLRHFIHGLPSSQPFQRVESTDLWYLPMELPARSRVEYKIERVVDGNHEWLMDPLNPRIARDPYGANSVCHGEGYVTPEWTTPDEEARPGMPVRNGENRAAPCASP